MKALTSRMSSAPQILIGMLLTLLPLMAPAQGNLVLNGSFESWNPFVPLREGVPFWHFEAGLAVNEGAAQGANFAMPYFMFQDIATVPGQTYQVRFAFGGNWDSQENLGPLHVRFGLTDIAVIPVT